MKPSLGYSSLIVAPLLAVMGCGPESDSAVVVVDASPRACAQASDSLADGLQTGDEIILSVECLNTTGAFDSLIDVLQAMQSATDDDGAPLLDLWVSAINEELVNYEGGPVTVAITPSQIADATSQLLGFVESGAPAIALDLLSEAIDARVVDAGLQFSATLLGEVAGLNQTAGQTGGPDLAQWLDSVQALLCQQDPSTGQPCRSSLQRFLAGASVNAEATEYNADDPANDDLQQTLSWLLYADGDVTRANASATGLARGLAELSQPVTFLDGHTAAAPLETAVTKLLPALFGDDPSTPYVYEGYPSHNPKDSALYGVMLNLRDQTVQEALEASTPETQALAFNFYEAAAYPTVGNSVRYREAECKTPREAPETHGVANNGVEQLVRLFSATNVSYRDNAMCSALFAPLLIFGSPYLDVSGSSTVGSLILEFSAVLPLELLKVLTGAMNTEIVVTVLNTACEMNLQNDDVEVLEALVYFPHTPVYSFPLLGALTDVGKVDALVDFLDAMWQTHALCEMAPTVRLAFDPAAPEGDAEGGDLNDILPDPNAPVGSTYHDQVIEPLLEVLMDFGYVAPTLMAPMKTALVEGEDDLSNLLLNLGAMASAEDTALKDIALLQAELSQLGGEGGAADFGPVAEAMDRDDIVQLMALTLSAPEVIKAVSVGTNPEDTSLLEALSAHIKAGTLDAFLAILEAGLRDLDSESQSE